jgi:hypothetical protein
MGDRHGIDHEPGEQPKKDALDFRKSMKKIVNETPES